MIDIPFKNVLQHVRDTMKHSINLSPLIVFEGPDGSGKTTYSRMFVPWLHNNMEKDRAIALMRQPSRFPGSLWQTLGAMVANSRAPGAQRMPSETEAMLIATIRHGLIEEFRYYQEQKAEWIVSDRWKLSFIAHQLHGNDLISTAPDFCDWIMKMDVPINPTITIHLDASDDVLDTRLSRIASHFGNHHLPEYTARQRAFYRNYRTHCQPNADSEDAKITFNVAARGVWIHQEAEDTPDQVFSRVLRGFVSMMAVLSKQLTESVTLEPQVLEMLSKRSEGTFVQNTSPETKH